MPATQQYVEVNVDGEWVHAYVVGKDSGSLVVEFRSPQTSDWRRETVAQGTGNGQYREP